MSDTFVMSSRQAAELDHALERNGWTPADVKLLSKGNALTEVLRLVRGDAVIAPCDHFIDCDKPFLPKGGKLTWEVKEHEQQGKWGWNPAKVTLYTNAKQSAPGGMEALELQQKLKHKRPLNGSVAGYLLRHPHLIPEEWKNYVAVAFWGSTYTSSEGDIILGLSWYQGKWKWTGCWFTYFSTSFPAVVLR